MKNISKILCSMILIFFCSSFFAGCEMFLIDTEETPDQPLVPVPTQIMVEGYSSEVVVGEPFYTKLNVSQFIEEEWKEVPKADYVCVCDYDLTTWGEYEMVVYLKDYPGISFSDVITVNPIIITAPSFSTVYSGEMVDIQTELMNLSEGKFTVSSYTNYVNAGTYEATLELTNTNKYVWATNDGYTTNKRQKITWEIQKAPAKAYSGAFNFEINSGETLYNLIHNSSQNNLKYITFLEDDAITPINMNSVITQSCTVYAVYNENSLNYYDSNIIMFNINVKNA